MLSSLNEGQQKARLGDSGQCVTSLIVLVLFYFIYIITCTCLI